MTPTNSSLVELPLVGQPVERTDARLKVTGQARYSADIPVENLAYAVLMCSTISNGRIDKFDISAAERAPGVLAVLTPFNAPRLKTARLRRHSNRAKPSEVRQLNLLQEPAVFYSGQPIGVVVADTREQAMYAASLVRVDYQSKPPLIGMAQHAAQAFIPNSEEAQSSYGDVAAGLREGEVELTQHYATPAEAHNPLEPHTTLAMWDGDRLTVYDATQAVFKTRERLAALFGLPPDHVRIICHFVGGGFGSKGPMWSHVPLTAMAARQVGRPVKLELLRTQMFGPVGYRSETRQTVGLAAKPDGYLTAIRHEGLSQSSVFDDYVEYVGNGTARLYACPNIATKHQLVRLNTGTPSYMRAPGEAAGSVALEIAIDEMAYRLNMDPLEFRLRNYAQVDPSSGNPWSSKSLRECYQQGAERFGWSRRNPEPRSMREGHELVGYGMATTAYPTHNDSASARARLLADGSALIQCGTQDIGTGTYTVLAQLAAETLSVPVEQVRIELGDTTLPEAPMSTGSRTCTSAGSAVFLAAQALRDKLIARAVADRHSPLFGLSGAKVATRAGYLFQRTEPGRSERYTDLLRRNILPEMQAEAEAEPGEAEDKYSMAAFGAHFAEVRVDAELGTVRLARYVSAFAAGRILNAKTACNQFRGGIVWGIGMALMEHMVSDPQTGRVITADLDQYLVPVNADVPFIDIIIVPEHDPYVNPIGVKGIGEIGIVGAPAAIVNAVFHATGKRIRELPVTADKLL